MGTPWTFTTPSAPLPLSQEDRAMIRISGAHNPADHIARPDDDYRPGAACRMCGRVTVLTADGRWRHAARYLADAVDAVREDMAADGATDPRPYVTDQAARMYGVTAAEILRAMA